MKLPIIQRFQKQDYPGSPDWFTRFIADLNSFTEIAWNILNKNITLADNVDSQVYTFPITAGLTAADNTLSFELTMNHPPSAMILGGVVDQAAYSAALPAAAAVQWTQSGTAIRITGISGLVPGQTYSVTVVLL